MSWAAAGALLVATYGIWAFGGWGEDGVRAATRFTARFGFPIFIAAWSASSLARLWPGGWRSWLLVNRRGLGLGFASAHLVHGAFVAMVLLNCGYQSSIATLIGGSIGYVFVIAMALTSNDWSVKRLGKNWRLMHSTGGYVLWFIFAFTYFGLLHKDLPLAVFGLTLCLGALGLRAAAKLVRERQSPQNA